MIKDLTTATAWHDDPALKAEVVERLRLHRAEDSIVQGLYQKIDPELGSEYRGCAIGCTLPKQPGGKDPARGWHAEVERLYGIPAPVGFLIDRCFEGLPADRAGDFAVAVVAAVPVGADLSMVTSRLMLDVLGDPERGVLRFAKPGTAQRDAVESVIGLYGRRLDGDEPSCDEWLAARRAAADAAAAAAAAYAAYAAAAAAAAYAAYAAAAAAAAYAAAAAAAAAAYAAYAAAAARRSQWTWTAERLSHHLTTAPVQVTA